MNNRHTALILSIVLAVISIAGVVLGSKSVLALANDVDFYETGSIGDPSAASGLKVEYTKNTTRRLRWNAFAAFGESDPECSAEYEYLSNEEMPYVLGDYLNMYLSFEDSELLSAYEQGLASELEPGETVEKVVRLKDIITECYPHIQWHAEGQNFSLEPFMKESPTYSAFMEFFRFEIPDDLWIRLEVEKSGEGPMGSFGSRRSYIINGQNTEVAPYIGAEGTYYDGNFYINIDYPAYMSSPLKRGLYKVPYEKLSEPDPAMGQSIKYAPQLAKAELLYAAGESERIAASGEFEDDSAMYIRLINDETGANSVMIFRYADGLLQRIELGLNGQKWIAWVPAGDCLAGYCSGELLFCIYSEGGRYAVKFFPTDGIDSQTLMEIERYMMRVAFDGNRAAVISRNYADGRSTAASPPVATRQDAFNLAVLTEDGLQYFTRLYSSLLNADMYWMGANYQLGYMSSYNTEITKAEWQ